MSPVPFPSGVSAGVLKMLLQQSREDAMFELAIVVPKGCHQAVHDILSGKYEALLKALQDEIGARSSQCTTLPPASSLMSLERLYAMSTPEVKRPDTPLLATFPREGVAFITALQDLEEYHKNDSFTTPFSPTFYDNIFNNTLPILPHNLPTPGRSQSHNSPKRTRDEEDDGYTSDESRNSKPKRHQTSPPLFSATSGAMKTLEIGASRIGSEGNGVAMGNVGDARNDAVLPECGVETGEKSMKSNDGAEGVADVIETGKDLEKMGTAGEKVDEQVASEKYGFGWIGSLFHKVLPIRQRAKAVQKQ